jgi:hypothetical protein
MTLSSSVPQTMRKKVSFETMYADRVENVYTDRGGKVYTDRFAPSQPSREASYCDSRGICCDSLAAFAFSQI